MDRLKKESLGTEQSIDSFVEQKLKRFSRMEHDFASLFSLMFSEESNTIYETGRGFEIEKLTYGQARSNALKRSAALKEALGEQKKDAVVGLYQANGPEWIENFWAILLIGCRPLLLNMQLDDASLNEALRSTDAVAVVSEGKTFQLPVVLSDSLKETVTEKEPEVFGSEILLMSSGTSANIKICAYTAEEIYYQVLDSYQIIRDCKLMRGAYRGELKQLALLPFYHVFGLVAMYLWFGFFSRTFVHLPDLSPKTVQSTILRHGVTHIFAVPLFWEKIYEQAIRTIKDRGEAVERKFNRALALSVKLDRIPPLGKLFKKYAFKEVRENLFGESIRFLITGGSMIEPSILAFFNGIGYRLANGYGMSEIGICSVELDHRAKYLHAGYVGKPLSSLEYRINEGGELEVRGKSISHYVMECGFKRTCPDWFNTHDLAECENGHYRILGRKDDLVIGPEGENLNPNLVEAALRTDGIGELCLFQAEGPTLLCSVRGDLSEEEFEDLTKRLQEKMIAANLAGKIKKISFTTDPLLGEGEFKCNRRLIREKYRKHAFRPLSAETIGKAMKGPDDPLYEEILLQFAKVLNKNPGEISPQMNFFMDLGGTSLDYFALLNTLRETYGIEFPVSAGMNLGSPEAVYEYIKTESTHVH
ncbi:MAG: non-ribosomal peptide synthetase [Lachnospiraceae bacterium]|nr:non-ribosomal peptide synthetase [Lachnospiraceae bacterium]